LAPHTHILTVVVSFLVSFEILGMLSQTFHIPDTFYTNIPNPTPDPWDSRTVSMPAMLRAFKKNFELTLPDRPRNTTVVAKLNHHLDEIINHLDERPIGFRQGALPYLSFGLSGSARYRNFDFSVTWSGAGFQSFERTSEMRVPFWNNANSPAYVFEDRWRREDPFDLDSSWIPGKYPLSRRNVTDHSNLRKSDFWVTNVNYLRLESIELGYTLPQTALDLVRLRSGRVFLNGYNVFSFDNTGEFGIDPELASGNGLQYPQMRTINVGVALGL
jgi:hypothetical protein